MGIVFLEQTGRRIDRQADRPTDKHMDKQTKTNRQRNTYHLCIVLTLNPKPLNPKH